MMTVLFTNLILAVAGVGVRVRSRLDGVDREGGFTTLEWAVIGSIAFAMAVAIGAGLTAVANNYLGKIG